jgi:hypothetical protein
MGLDGSGRLALLAGKRCFALVELKAHNLGKDLGSSEAPTKFFLAVS